MAVQPEVQATDGYGRVVHYGEFTIRWLHLNSVEGVRIQMWLKFYSGFMFILIISTFGRTGLHGFMDYFNLAESVLELMGLFGYAFRIRSFNELFWKITFPIFILADLFANFYQGGGGVIIALNIGFQAIFGFPMYMSLYRYAFRSRTFWQSSK